MKKTISFAAAAFMFVPSLAYAQDEEEEANEYVIEEEPDSKKKDGVHWRINAGATLSFSDNRTVIGQTDGSTLAFGLKFDSGIDWRKEVHELRTNLALAAGVTRTPVVPLFVKSQDSIEAEAIYLYHVVEWFGFFARAAWSSSMFRGTDVRPEEVTYNIARTDGSIEPVVGNRLTLTDSLKPSRFKESLGPFVQPYASDPITVELRAGAGARHILAAGQLAVDDDDATPEIEVVELAAVHQLGAEAVLEIWGTFAEDKVTYKVGAEAMTPFLHNELPAGDDRTAFELTNVELRAGLSFKLVDWASLDYTFKALREPQLLDDWQLQNQLLLTFGVAAGSAKPETEE